MDHGHERNTGDTKPLTPAVKISRRDMVAGMVATTAVAVLPLSNSAFAQTSDQENMVAFLVLSAALTGVDIHTLAPEFPTKVPDDVLSADPGTDPINVKNAYFDWIKAHSAPPSFANLLQIAKDNRRSQDNIIAKVNASDDGTKFLARSIVLLWYLGSWYEPADLKSAAASPESVRGPIQQRVLSAKAYTQGLVWLIVGAHPMGYSNLQFGHWSHDPHDQNGNPVQLFSPAKFPL
jgi:hypothetical protein